MISITAVGSKVPQMEKKSKEEKSIPYRMGYCFVADIHHLFDTYTISINPDVYILNSHLVFLTIANNHPRIMTRLYALRVIERVSLEHISIKAS